MARSIFCGDTNYKNQPDFEIRRDFKAMHQETRNILSKRQEIDDRKETPVDIGIQFRQVFHLADQINELCTSNKVSLYLGCPSLVFCDTLVDVGKKAHDLHLELGKTWNGLNYYNLLGSNSTECQHYKELKDYCCSMMDLENLGFEVKQRYFDEKGRARYPSLPKRLGEFIGGVLKGWT